jgi:DNA-directed RNA polymerase subunit N (RpoN/RPB10)
LLYDDRVKLMVELGVARRNCVRRLFLTYGPK